jgi:hypothetical protein
MNASVADSSSAVKPDNLILDADALYDKVKEWQSNGWHILTPATRVSRLAPQWGATVSLVLMDARVDETSGAGTDAYYDKATMKAHERGISRVGLMRIAGCAGISWDPVHSGRTDPRTILHYWEFRMVGVVMDFDGTPRTIYGTGEVDYRDGSAQIGGWTPELWRQLEAENAAKQKANPRADVSWSINGWSAKRVLNARAKGLQRCETNAMERAIRSLGLLHKYTVEQLKHPFVVLKASYLPDMQDPEIRAMVAERALSGTRALFAPQTSRPIPVVDITPQPWAAPEKTRAENIARTETMNVFNGHTTSPLHTAPVPVDLPPAASTAAAPSSSATTSPTTTTPYTPGAKAPGWRKNVVVLNVETMKSGKSRYGEWALEKITLGIGSAVTETHTTLDAGIAGAARDMKDSGALADVNVQRDEKDEYLNVVEVLPAGQQQGLPGVFENDLPPPVSQMKW